MLQPTQGVLVLSEQIVGDSVVLHVGGEITRQNSRELRADITCRIGRRPPQWLVLDLRLVPYMDSSACAALVEAVRVMRRHGGRVCLVNLQPRVRGILEIARLVSIFMIAKDQADVPLEHAACSTTIASRRPPGTCGGRTASRRAGVSN